MRRHFDDIATEILRNSALEAKNKNLAKELIIKIIHREYILRRNRFLLACSVTTLIAVAAFFILAAKSKVALTSLVEAIGLETADFLQNLTTIFTPGFGVFEIIISLAVLLFAQRVIDACLKVGQKQ